MIISVDHKAYIRKRNRLKKGSRHNGAFYYAKEIEQNMIPLIETDRNWVLVNIPPYGADHAIVFIHNNLHPENYEWLKRYNDLILVCGVEETVEKVKHLGKAIYLPLSVDVEYVRQFKKQERYGTAFAGRASKKRGFDFPPDTIFLQGMERDELLDSMSRFDTVYAVGRTAIEAKILGCKLRAYDDRYPKVRRWKILDNKKAAKMLQQKLNEIDGCGIIELEGGAKDEKNQTEKQEKTVKSHIV